MANEIIEKCINRILNECCYVPAFSTSIQCDMEDAVGIVKQMLED